MAQTGVQLDRETFSCSVCLDLLKDPVTIPCGHSYCMNCIEGFWDEDREKNPHSCPQCRQTFTPRPVLVKNTMLADLVEQLKETGLQAAPADHCYAGPEDVACDFCTGRKLRAFKSCLVCLVSYCETHLQPHYDVAPFKKHNLVEPSKKLWENVCSRHDEVMKMFCRTDQQRICYLCSVDEHKGHDTVSAAAERTERQKELEENRQRIQQKIQDIEKDVKLLQQEVEAISDSADTTVENSEKIFTELIRLLETRRSELKQQIRSQQETETSRVKELQEKLEQEIMELKRKDAELEQLSHTEDHNQFLLNYPSLSELGEGPYFSLIEPVGLQHFDGLNQAVLDVTGNIETTLKVNWVRVSATVAQVDVLLSQQPDTRDEFLKWRRHVTLDPNTAHRRLLLSDGDRRVTFMKNDQCCPEHLDRSSVSYQVLGREGLTGRCYWEVEKSLGGVCVAVSYKDSDTATDTFGNNHKSWALDFYKRCYEFRHDKVTTRVPGPRSSRVGVFLDHRAGLLSFYSVSGTMTLLHRVQTTFSQPLYAGLGLYGPLGNAAELCEL